MPLVIDNFLDIAEDNARELAKGGYYVYAWACADWGGIYYYVGKGTGNRYSELSARGRCFKAIFEKWNVFPVILAGGLTADQAEQYEDEIKTEFIFEHGYPIMDGEGRSSAIKNRAIRLAKAEKRAENPNWKEGRPRKEIPEFEKFLKKQKDGQMTVSQCCSALGISRSTYYAKARNFVI